MCSIDHPPPHTHTHTHTHRYNTGRNHSRVFPKIAGVAFVGSVPGRNRFIDFDQLNDLIYDVATEMKAPKGQCQCVLLVAILSPITFV